MLERNRWKRSEVLKLLGLTLTLGALTGCAPETTLDTSEVANAEAASAQGAAAQTIPESHLPAFTADGKLREPADWQEWVMVGASIGLSYNEEVRSAAAGASPGMFHRVYVQQWAYREFLDRGEFPEQTMFVLSFFQSAESEHPRTGGFYEGDLIPAMEIHLKREGVHESGWGFYMFSGGSSEGELFAPDAACYSCHAENADHDNVFVQFYPTIRARLAESESGDG